MNRFSLIIGFTLLLSAAVSARENIGGNPGKLGSSEKLATDCVPASSSVDLNINNIRARLQNGGDMWWDLVNTAKYEVPKSLEGQPENPSSLFAGAVWIGGIDAQKQLKLAAATYRQTGNDFFPGPLDENGSVDATTCKLWDKHYQVYGAEIDSFLELIAKNGGILASSKVPKNILNWPAYGNPYNPQVGNRNMAPFEDVDFNGYYDPTTGDYPVIDQTCEKKTYADQMVWWVYNDNGNIHTESGSTAIGMEIQALAFAFKTNDEINDMTFYKYKVLNKATLPLDSTFMGQWIDPDLGCYTDDYIGCDIETGLGIVYNANASDAASCALNYGNQPPYLGFDYFQGPFDENGDRLGLSSFLYFVNDFSQIGNPENASDYYGYLSGTWKDGTPFTQDGNAYGGTTPTKYVFPDDPSNANGWSQCAAGVTPADMRTLQNSGPFLLNPGASNDLVIGVVWIRPPIGTYPCPSFKLLKQADNKAQDLFNTCFKLIDGPSAPDIEIVELDKELILSLVNTNTKTVEQYVDVNASAAALSSPDSLWKFEGYQVYQLIDGNVSAPQYTDITKARLVFQCDLKNGVSKLINYIYDADLDLGNPNLIPNVPVLEVDGADLGIKHSIQITSDAFATSNKILINHRTYYFSVVSYAYNYYEVKDTIKNDSGVIVNITTTVQLTPYLQGRKNIKIYSGIPHITEPEKGGLVLNSVYGDGPQMTRQEGTGNGKLITDLTDESITSILNSPTSLELHQKYLGARGPVNISVYNPKVVPNADFELTLTDTLNPTSYLNASSTKWKLKNLTTGEEVLSDYTIDNSNEQLIPDWGLSLFLEQTRNPGGTEAEQATNNNGFLEATIEFADAQKAWLDGIHDDEGESPLNWIRAGTFKDATAPEFNDWTSPFAIDENQVYEKLIDGTWAPYRLASDQDNNLSVAFKDVSHTGTTFNPLDSLISVDVVFTPDRTKWSKCIVIETQYEAALSEGGAAKFNLRKGTSKDIDGNLIPGETGSSYFPGYAINAETGERLNIFFGEDSWLVGQNGRDMWWNPTGEIIDPTFSDLWFGGKQYIYVARTKYDGCESFKTYLSTLALTDKRNVYAKVCWVTLPLLATNSNFSSIADGYIPTETKVRIRVTKPYKVFNTDVNTNGGQPHYTFNTGDIAAITNDNATAVTALDTIGVVPNPYYAYSTYEVSQIDNRIKITNLPQKCTITIYSLDGILIRKFTRDDSSITSVDWDLKNDAGVPIASGLYIIHIEAPGLGEKTIKWFGIMRPADLSNY